MGTQHGKFVSSISYITTMAWKICLFYFLYSQLYIWMSSGHVLIMWKLSCMINDDHIFLSFGKDLPGQSSCHLYMAFQLLQNQASGHIKVKKGTGHVFCLATPSHTNESAVGPEPVPPQHQGILSYHANWQELYQLLHGVLGIWSSVSKLFVPVWRKMNQTQSNAMLKLLAPLLAVR